MSTTIDSLQIEIKSASTDAAKGIDALAESLGKIKSNGSFKTVSTNLNHLSEALNKLPNVHGASNSLRTLANSIEKLKGVGTVSSLSNSLKKLPEAFKSLGSINLTNAKEQIQGVADAVYPLTQVRNSGFSSMVNSMAKLKSVTESLDTETLGKFEEKIKRLDAIVGPFATKMGTIKTALGGINTELKQTSVSVDNVNAKVNVTAFNFSNLANVFSTVHSALQSVIQGFTRVMEQAIEWDGIAARFGRSFGDQAEETYNWIQRLNEEMGINVQQFMQYSSLYAQMLTGFGVAQKDASKMALGYAELTYDIWASANDRYNSFSDVADAVASAIAGEVEPIRRAGFTIVESTLEETAAFHGLDISIANATEAQKSYLRYLTLVDQAQKNGVIGVYAKELNTAEGMMRTFSQQLKSLAQAFGSLFLPILVKVMPYLQAFVELLEEGVRWIAGLFGVEIQDISGTWGDYSSGVADAVENTNGVTDALDDATKAAKELKNASIGIDELNVISPPSSASGSGAGGSGGASGGGDGFSGLDIDSLWDESIFDSIQSNVDTIKEKLKNWLPVIGGIATALAGLKLTSLLDDIELAGFKLGNLGKGLTLAGITVAVGKLVWDFTGAYLEGGDEADLLKAIGTTTIGAALARWLVGKPGVPIVLLTSGIVTLTRLGIAIGEGTVEWNDPESLVTGLVGGIETAIGAVFTWKTLAPIVKAAWPKIVAAATPVLSAAAPYLGVAAAVAAGIALAFIDYDFTDVGKKLGEAVGNALRKAGGFIGEKISAAWTWIWENLDIDDFWDVTAIMFVPGELWRRLELGELFKTIGGWILEKLQNLKGNVEEFFGGFFDGVMEGLGQWAVDFADIFDIDYWTIVEAIINPFTLGDNIIKGVIEGIKSKSLFDGVKEKFSGFVEDVKKFFGIKSPSTLMKNEIGAYLIPGITEGMSLNGIRDKLSSVWSTAKTWWNTKKGSLKAYTPSIGSIKDKLSSAWTTAKNWWSKNRSSLSYTPSIGSIKTKLSSAWTTAKNWWNKSKGSMSYTPSIGSIVDKVKSAWNTAKNWWNKNVGSLSTKINIKVPTISINWKSVDVLGKTFKYPTSFNVKFAADGGIFDAGSLIWAGERGPEILANASGGKTGVMNVQQMQEAVYDGVYAAVVAAMRGNGERGTQSVNVYLDGRQITAAVEQRQRERGASIMGNEVYAY